MKQMGRRLFLSGGLLAASLHGGAASASEHPWILLGTATVCWDLDSVEIRGESVQRLFTHLRLRVNDNARSLNAVRMNDLIVTFGNGERLKLPVQARVRVGGETGEFNLSEGKRFIRHVRLHYRLVPSLASLTRRAGGTVELWGRR